MENIVDWDELEADLTGKAGTKKMWISIFAIVGILAITYLTTTLKFDSRDFTGVPGTGWYWDYNNFWVLMLSACSTVIVMGLKIQAGLSKVIAKQKIIASKNKQLDDLAKSIALKNTEIAVLKRQLSDACDTHDANKEALVTITTDKAGD